MQRKMRICDMDINYSVDYRNIKYPRLEFKTGDLLFVLPKNYEKEGHIAEKYKDWIVEKQSQIFSALKESKNKKLVLDRDVKAFKEVVTQYTQSFCRELNLKTNNIIFRTMNSKWASCSKNKNLTLNTLLRYLPESLIKYVVYHEIIHLKEKRHNERFWSMIQEKFSDFQKKEKDLLIYWFLIKHQKRN